MMSLNASILSVAPVPHLLAQQGPDFNWMTIFWIVVVLVGVWVVIGIVRGFSRRSQGPYPQQGRPMQSMGGGGAQYSPQYGGAPPAPTPMGGGGGGFVSSLLGGMFGAAAGNWIYDSFTGRGSHGGGWGAPPAHGGEPRRSDWGGSPSGGTTGAGGAAGSTYGSDTGRGGDWGS